MREDSLIREHRTADAVVTVTLGGAPLANRQVTVAQRNHKFLFGNIGFDFIPLANDEVEGEERAKLERLRARPSPPRPRPAAHHRQLVRRPRRGRQGSSAVLAYRPARLASAALR